MKELSISGFTPQMPTVARVQPRPKPGARASTQLSHTGGRDVANSWGSHLASALPAKVLSWQLEPEAEPGAARHCSSTQIPQAVSSSSLIFTIDDVYTVDQGGKGRGSGDNR